MQFSRPSTGTILGGIALFVALGGTALAATGTVVNIADPVTASQVARVDRTGALKTVGTDVVSGTVAETVPRDSFFGHAYLSASATNTLIAANTTTVALTRLDLENYFGQTNRADVDIRVYEQGGSATTCDGSGGSRAVGTYEVAAGQSFSSAIGTPIVLRPLASGHVWCLLASAAVQGGPGSYFLPEASYSGYVPSGNLPGGAVSKASSTGPERAGG
jgi:hypothetical protein